MRSLLIVAVLAGIAAADAPKPVQPDLVVTWQEGEMSRDMSIWRTTITVTGTKLHYARAYSGRDGGMPGTKPTDIDATVKDPKKVAAALAALDKLKIKVAKKPSNDDSRRMREGCIQRGKAERCARAAGTDPDPDDLKAIAAVRDALLDGVKIPDSL